MIVGITGISGSGKSTVANKICEIMKVKRIDADKIAKDMQKQGQEYFKEIVSTFGNDILDDNNEINRKKLAEIIFLDKNKKQALDNLTLKYVIPRIKKEARDIANNNIAIIDAALLFEMELNKFCDINIGVISKYQTCVNRICKRDNLEIGIAKARIDNQKNQNFFKINCNYCISNETDDNLEKQILEIFNKKNLSNENIIHMYSRKSGVFTI